MADIEMNFEPLGHLLKASSKDQVQKLCAQSFMYRDLIQPPDEVVKKTSESLKIETKDTIAPIEDILSIKFKSYIVLNNKLLHSLSSLVRQTLFHNCSDAASVAKIFPDNFHRNLKDLLSKIIAENLSSWKSNTISSQVSLPKLMDFDWRVDIKSSSDSLSRMSVPTCILQLKIQEDAATSESISGIQSLNVELSKEKLEAMLDGLGKIRGQLNSVAKRN